ncbi:MAG: ROK family glucokinase [Actinomycetota bacterium]|nr:ROK family glucokinase [Actinomycetota bacterium]
MGVTVGVDVGGTKIASGVVDEHGAILEQEQLPTPAATGSDAAAAIAVAIADLVTRHRERHDVVAVGVGAAGFVDSRRSTVMFAPNIAWRDEPLRDRVMAKIHLPTVIENDANAAAWAEFQFGAGEHVDDLILLTVGTGIGGGIVLDGALHRGAFGVAAEVGHMRVVPHGERCGCGNRGCWEQYASGRALVREARELVGSGSPLAAALADACGGDVDALEGPMVTQLAQDGDLASIELVGDVGRWLGSGLASLADILDPAVAVIGGGVSAAGELLLEPLRDTFRRELSGRGHRPMLEIRPAEMGNTAGIVGAADLSRQP